MRRGGVGAIGSREGSRQYGMKAEQHQWGCKVQNTDLSPPPCSAHSHADASQPTSSNTLSGLPPARMRISTATLWAAVPTTSSSRTTPDPDPDPPTAPDPDPPDGGSFIPKASPSCDLPINQRVFARPPRQERTSGCSGHRAFSLCGWAGGHY